ncbi:hypothetical protein JXJ21_25540 [candidate division KSB1 bacterium]|nr:hypothetical protein [candidate division KSB1 bacterium]
MIISKSNLLKFAFGIALLVMVSQLGAERGRETSSNDDLQLSAVSKQILRIRFNPQLTGISATGDTSHRMLTFGIKNASCRMFKNGYVLPVRKILINLPSNINPEVRIIRCVEKAAARDIIPAGISVTNTDSIETIIENSETIPEVTIGAGMLPAAPYKLSPPALLRNRYVCELLLYPVRIDSARNQYLLCREIEMEIRLPGANHASASVVHEPSAFGRIYSSIFINQSNDALLTRPAESGSKSVQSINENQYFRIKIGDEGVYALIAQDLRQLGIEPQSISPENLHIYYGGGRELPVDIALPVPEFKQVATLFSDQNLDGSFGDDDALIFYAQAVSGWHRGTNGWQHYINHYSVENVYWLYIAQQPRKAMPYQPNQSTIAESLTPRNISTTHIFEEQERVLPEYTGIDWMWDKFTGTRSRLYSVAIDDSITGDSVNIKLRLKGLSEAHHAIDLYFNDNHFETIDLPYTLGKIFTSKFPTEWLHRENELRIKLTGLSSTIGFDWYEMEYKHYLVARDEPLAFFSAGHTGWTKFELTNFPGKAPLIFDISDPFETRLLQIAERDSVQATVSFIDSIGSASEKRYLAIAPGKIKHIPSPEALPYYLDAHLKDPSNEADYLIVTHESLLGPALDRFIAHRSNPDFWQHQGIPNLMTVTTQEIYDQFAFGLVDPVALRNFLKYALENWQKAPEYVLFVGDATYDFKDIYGLGKILLVPSFELYNKVSDDWLVNLTRDRYPDMICGRLPVNSQEELAIVVDKIIRHEIDLPVGLWRSRLTLIADDSYQKNDYHPEDYVFIRDSEILANGGEVGDFDISKIYLSRYLWDRSFNKPRARTAFIDALNEGTLLINFLGHANWNMLTHENIFRTPYDLPFVQNQSQLPLFYAGTCEVARIDDPHITSMAEDLLLHPDGGVIACIGSARWTIHAASFNVSQAFFKMLFSDSLRSAVTIGQALLQAKMSAGFPDQTEVMFLIGDPALRLAAPSLKINLNVEPDTLSLTRRILINGCVTDGDDSTVAFDGSCGLRLYDASTIYTNPLYDYSIPGKVLLETEIPVNNGTFAASVFASADTSAGGPLGRLVAHAWQKNQETPFRAFFAAGKADSLLIQSDSLSASVSQDTLPPELLLSVAGIEIANGETGVKLTVPFQLAGDLYDTSAGFAVPVSENLGIQFAIDGQAVPDFTAAAQLQFESPENKKGTFAYRIESLSQGTHQLSLLVYDKSLNLAQWESEVVVVSNNLVIANAMNFPNPAREHTAFTFDLSQDAAIQVKIYTVSGRCIRKLKGMGALGFNIFPADGWLCTDEDGDKLSNGVYLYKIIATALKTPLINNSGQTQAEHIGKLIVIN